MRGPEVGGRGRRGVPRAKQGRPWYVPTFKRMLWVGFLGVLGTSALVGVGYAVTDIPTAHELAQAEATMVYYRDGTPIGKLAKQNRVSVDIEDVPEHVRYAVLAAENRDFYSEPGISPKGIIRAMWSMARGQQLQSGSTITQQYAKIAFLSQERTVSRKVKEMFIAIKLDKRRSKDWILEQYLNTIYFGRGAYGVQAASQAYFHKDVDKLTPAQGAALATLIQVPEYYSQPENREAFVQRWRYVIDGMVQMRKITPAQAAQAKPPKFKAPQVDNAFAGQKGYLLHQAITELRRLGYSEDDIYRSGLRVTTTFDRRLQKYAVQAVKQERPESWPRDVETGLVAVQPGTGEVTAVYGGRNYLKDQYDNVFLSKAQVGSSFKPYVLAAALDNGIGLRSMVDGSSPQTFKGGYKVKNSGRIDYGPITLLQATKNSVNTAYVNLALKVGLSNVAETAEEAGIPEDAIEPHANRAGLALGIASIHPVDQAAGFAAFAAQGTYAKPHVIRKVENSSGEVETKVKRDVHRAFDRDVAADATYAMQQVVRGGTATAAKLVDRPVAGKTGTTDENRAVWFCGFTPQLSTTVAMFRAENKPLRGLPGYSQVYGGSVPAGIWHAFMEKAMANKPVEQFPEPAWVGTTHLYATPTPTPTPTPTHTATPTPTHEPSASPSPWDDGSDEPQPTEEPGWPFGGSSDRPNEATEPPRRQG